MALLNKLKSILGIGGGRDREDQRTDTSVTVEREASEPASEGTTASPTSDGESTDADGPVAAGTDATASTGSMTESAAAEPETAAEPSEAAAPPSDSGDEDDESDGDVGDVIDEAEPSTDADESVAAGTDATASTDSLVDEQTDPDEAAEPGEATGPPTGSIDDHDEPESHPDEPVETIKGIGPAYSDRLGDAGIESVSSLAAADAEELGAAIGVSPKIVADWIDRAEDE